MDVICQLRIGTEIAPACPAFPAALDATAHNSRRIRLRRVIAGNPSSVFPDNTVFDAHAHIWIDYTTVVLGYRTLPDHQRLIGRRTSAEKLQRASCVLHNGAGLKNCTSAHNVQACSTYPHNCTPPYDRYTWTISINAVPKRLGPLQPALHAAVANRHLRPVAPDTRLTILDYTVGDGHLPLPPDTYCLGRINDCQAVKYNRFAVRPMYMETPPPLKTNDTLRRTVGTCDRQALGVNIHLVRNRVRSVRQHNNVAGRCFVTGPLQ